MHARHSSAPPTDTGTASTAVFSIDGGASVCSLDVDTLLQSGSMQTFPARPPLRLGMGTSPIDFDSHLQTSGTEPTGFAGSSFADVASPLPDTHITTTAPAVPFGVHQTQQLHQHMSDQLLPFAEPPGSPHNDAFQAVLAGSESIDTHARATATLVSSARAILLATEQSQQRPPPHSSRPPKPAANRNRRKRRRSLLHDHHQEQAIDNDPDDEDFVSHLRPNRTRTRTTNTPARAQPQARDAPSSNKGRQRRRASAGVVAAARAALLQQQRKQQQQSSSSSSFSPHAAAAAAATAASLHDLGSTTQHTLPAAIGDTDDPPVHPLVPQGYLTAPRNVTSSATRLQADQVVILKRWMAHPDHWLNPYPTDTTKALLAKQTGLKLSQVSDWFRNERKRTWLPLCRQPGSSLGRAVDLITSSPRKPRRRRSQLDTATQDPDDATGAAH